jgi:hypothetical protein
VKLPLLHSGVVLDSSKSVAIAYLQCKDAEGSIAVVDQAVGSGDVAVQKGGAFSWAAYVDAT